MDPDEKTKLYLVGYPGSGKTTIGKLLARKLNRSFIDMDEFIENRYRKTISAIFEEKGEAGFREIEHRVLQEVSSFENAVISTGGGLPCFFDNMDIMNRTGITVYLKAEVDELFGRLSFDKQKRPLIKGKSPEELRSFIEENLKKRELFYNRAKIIYEVRNRSAKQESESLLEKLLLNNQ